MARVLSIWRAMRPARRSLAIYVRVTWEPGLVAGVILSHGNQGRDVGAFEVGGVRWIRVA